MSGNYRRATVQPNPFCAPAVQLTSLRLGRLVCGELDDGFERVGCGDFHVGLDAGFGPIGRGERIDRFHFGDAHAEVVVDAMKDAGVRAATGGFADKRCASATRPHCRSLFGVEGSSPEMVGVYGEDHAERAVHYMKVVGNLELDLAVGLGVEPPSCSSTGFGFRFERLDLALRQIRVGLDAV